MVKTPYILFIMEPKFSLYKFPYEEFWPHCIKTQKGSPKKVQSSPAVFQSAKIVGTMAILYMYKYIYIYMYVSIYIYIYMYIYWLMQDFHHPQLLLGARPRGVAPQRRPQGPAGRTTAAGTSGSGGSLKKRGGKMLCMCIYIYIYIHIYIFYLVCLFLFTLIYYVFTYVSIYLYARLTKNIHV